MATGSMTDHRQEIYGKYPDIGWDRIPVIQQEKLPQLYEVSFPNTTNTRHCPFQG